MKRPITKTQTLNISSKSHDPISLERFHRRSFISRFFKIHIHISYSVSTRRFPSHLFDFAEPVAVGVAVRTGGFHRVDAGLLVGGCGGVPGFGARGGADCGLLLQ
jgi:hypothetical protein